MNYENSFLAIKKVLSDPPTENVIHFMNHCNMTFVFQSTKIDEYKNYLDEIFSLKSQIYVWHEDLKTHFMKPGNTIPPDDPDNHDNPFDYKWHCREPYHIVDDYYGITISKNSVCSNSHRILNDLIVNYEKLPFDWESYPGNLYIGNICKILT